MKNDLARSARPDVDPAPQHASAVREDAQRHTPTPWQVELDMIRDGDINICDQESQFIAHIDCRDGPNDTFDFPRETALANAAFIVRAANAHDGLVTLLNAIAADKSAYQWRVTIKAVLAKVELG
jgi:hypothetical protein